MDGESQTGNDTFAIHQNGASTAGALIAPFFGTGQTQVIAQHIQQGHAGIDGERVVRSIDRSETRTDSSDIGMPHRHTNEMIAVPSSARTPPMAV